MRHAPDFFRKHPERDDYEHIRLPCCQGFQKFRIFKAQRLQNRYPMTCSILLDRTFIDLETASARLVCHCYNANHLVSVSDKGVKRPDGKLRRAHIDDAHRLEESVYPALEPSPAYLELVYVQKFRIMYGLPCEEGAYRHKHVCRYESTVECIDGPVSCKLCPRDVHNPVEDEEQHRDDCAGAEAAFLDERSYRGADKEHDQAGKRLGESLQIFYVCIPDIEVLVVDVHRHVGQCSAHCRGVVSSPCVCFGLWSRTIPFQEVVICKWPFAGIAGCCVKLPARNENIALPECLVM